MLFFVKFWITFVSFYYCGISFLYLPWHEVPVLYPQGFQYLEGFCFQWSLEKYGSLIKCPFIIFRYTLEIVNLTILRHSFALVNLYFNYSVKSVNEGILAAIPLLYLKQIELACIEKVGKTHWPQNQRLLMEFLNYRCYMIMIFKDIGAPSF